MNRIDQEFSNFDKQNPHVYKGLVALAKQWHSAGHSRCSIDMLYHLMRWDTGIKTGGDTFRLNNNFTSRYARMIMDNNEELSGFFETRVLKTVA